MLVRYELDVPRSKRDAVRQGREVAVLERKRLDLGASPVRELPDLLVSQGVRTSEEALPDGLSGALLASDELGPLILVDAHHPRARRLFSYAHEYAHALLDRSRGAIVSRTSDREDLLEVRANSFAAHLLMPEAGVLSFLESVGKGDVGRQLQLVFDPEPASVRERITASKLYTTGSQVLQVHDVVRLAHVFGVSYSAAVYQLTNLSFLTRSACEALLSREVEARRLAKFLGADDREERGGQRLGTQLLALGFEAYRREIISRRKLLELASEAGFDADAVLAALSDDGLDEDAVPALIEE
jgi:Zn-dependent peptidase ImmA (M78 family)